MMAASDTEGARVERVHRRVVGSLRHGGGEVSRPLRNRRKLRSAAEPSEVDRNSRRRTRLGRALGKMRDRVFKVGNLDLRLRG